MAVNISDKIDTIHPANNAVSVILSDQIWIIFDAEIDENSVNSGNFFIEGPDTDTFIGPDVGLNLPNVSSSDSDDQLGSPGYKGIVPGSISFEKMQLTEVSAYSGFDTSGTGNIWRTKIIFTPQYRLSPLTEYTVYISGDEDITDGLATGIRARSIFDVVNGANSGTGEVTFGGTFTGNATEDTFVIKISSAGDSANALFTWWRGSDPSFIHGPIAAMKFQTVPLEEGVEVAFGNGSFAVNDTFSVVVRKPELFTGNMYWSFTTGSGSIQAVPTTTSTSIIGDTGTSTTSTTSTFTVVSTTPTDGSTNQPLTTANISVKFNSNITDLPGTDITAEPVNGDTSSVSNITYSGVLKYSKSIINSNTLSIELEPNQLHEDNLVVITVSGTSANSLGTVLGDDYIFWFTTLYNPLYSSVRKVRLEIGSFIKNITDDTINLAIYEASLMANEMSWSGKDSLNSLYLFARREWTTCKAAEMLLNNALSSTGLKSKELDNFRVTYDNKQGAAILDRIRECLARWEGELVSGGKPAGNPKGVVKGECDPDAPHVGRMWEKGLLTINPPGSNLRYKPPGQRRWVSGWYRRRVQ